jgi:molecular chaperone GrpE
VAEQPVGTAGKGDATAVAETDPVKEAQATLAQVRERLDHAEDQWRRAVAELDNLRKRVARDAERVRAEERARVAAEWLPVLDNLDLALEHAGSGSEAIVAGVRAVRDQAVAVLARLGFPRRDEEGAAFDPARHEAVAAAPAPGTKPGTVLRVVRPGYGDDAHQLRPAAVVVAAGDG